VRAIFFGTPAIAVPALEALGRVSELVGVVTQPDRPAGRGLAVRAPPVKERALALGLEVVQPEKVRTGELERWVRAREPDVAVVMAYGRILPPGVLGAPRRGCINLHASLLPRWRGAAPIPWAVASGDRETGISLMQMDEGCDTGPVYLARALAIGEDETAGELAERLGALAADVVARDLGRAVAGEIVATPQDASAATHAPPLGREHGRIDWSRPASCVHDHVRAMTPWPGARTTVPAPASARLLKVLATRRAAEGARQAGTIERIERERGALVGCGEGAVWLVRAQLEGRKPLDAHALAAGRALAPGMRLGEP
jgi:methionyl-tRNA formyltransferase